MLDRLAYVIVSAVIAAVMGLLQGHKEGVATADKTVKKLNSDIENLEWGIDYYTK